MANEKKVVFSGEGSTLLKLFDQIKTKRKELGLDDEKFAKISKDNANVLLKGLQLEIKERERLIRLQKEQNLLDAQKLKQERVAGGMSVEGAQKRYSQDVIDIREGALQDKSAVNEIKTLVEEIKKGFTVQQQEEKRPSILGDLLKFEAIKQVVKGTLNAIGSFGSSLAGAQDDTKFAGQLYSVVPGLISDRLGGAVQAAKDREEQEQKSRALSRASLRASTGIDSIGSNIGLGLDTNEANTLAMQYAKARGSSRGVGNAVFQSYAMQKAFGLEGSQMLEQEKLSKMTGVGSAQNTANMIAALKRSGVIKGDDYSKLPSLIEAQTAVIREQSQMMSNPNSGIAQGIVTSFSKLGGAFGDERLGERLSTVNQSLINPSGDFSQAMNFSALTSLPQYRNASYFDLLKAQQGGLSTEGFLGSKLGLLSQQYGGASSEGFKLGVMDATGLNASDSEKLAEAFKNNPNLFSKFAGTTTDLQKMFGSQPSGVTKYEQDQAQIGESFAKGFGTGILDAAKIAGSKMASEFVQDFGKYFGITAKEEGNKVIKGKNP